MRIILRWTLIAALIIAVTTAQGFIMWRVQRMANHEIQIGILREELKYFRNEQDRFHEHLVAKIKALEEVLFLDAIPKAEEAEQKAKALQAAKRPISPSEAWQLNRDAALRQRMAILEKNLDKQQQAIGEILRILGR